MRSKKAFYNIFSNLFLQIIVLIYGFIVPKLIIAHYGSSTNGLISSITQFLGYITLLESGMGPVVKSALYKPLARNDKKEIANIIKKAEQFFRIIALIFIIYLVAFSVFYPVVVRNEFDTFYTIGLIVILSISIFAEYYFGMVYKLFLQADQKTYVISILQFCTYIVALLVIVFMVNINTPIHILKLSSGLIFLSRPIIQNIYVKKKYDIDFSNYDNNYVIKNKWDGLSQHIAYVIHTNTDITVLTLLRNLTEVSIYSVYSIVNKGIKAITEAFSLGIDSSFGDMIAKKEINNLRKRFNTYEVFFFILICIMYSSALVLIIPFITIYTSDIKDANYVIPLFGWLIIISEYIWSIRQPYNLLVKAAGHFKETRIGAWIECISNIVISIILVNKFGLIGVAIGTIVAMTIRSIEFVYHTNKYILKRSVWNSIKKLLLIIIETLMIVLICNKIPFINYSNYLNWIINAIIVVIVSALVTISLNLVFYKDEFKEMIGLLKNVVKKNKKV